MKKKFYEEILLEFSLFNEDVVLSSVGDGKVDDLPTDDNELPPVWLSTPL